MASRTGPRAAWACSGVGPRVWTAWARAWSWSVSGMASRTGRVRLAVRRAGRRYGAEDGPRAAWACSGVSLGAEGLDGLGQGLELVGVGGLADGVEDGTEKALDILGLSGAGQRHGRSTQGAGGQGVDLIAVQRELAEEGIADRCAAGGQVPRARTEASDLGSSVPSKSSRPRSAPRWSRRRAVAPRSSHSTRSGEADGHDRGDADQRSGPTEAVAREISASARWRCSSAARRSASARCRCSSVPLPRPRHAPARGDTALGVGALALLVCDLPGASSSRWCWASRRPRLAWAAISASPTPRCSPVISSMRRRRARPAACAPLPGAGRAGSGGPRAGRA